MSDEQVDLDAASESGRTDGSTTATHRRALLKALAAAPVILSVTSFNAHAGYDKNHIYHVGSCNPHDNSDKDFCNSPPS